jgi:hypothetical protein
MAQRHLPRRGAASPLSAHATLASSSSPAEQRAGKNAANRTAAALMGEGGAGLAFGFGTGRGPGCVNAGAVAVGGVGVFDGESG